MLLKPKKFSKTIPDYIIGIDEAGRGPLAGPVAVGTVRIGKNFDKKFFRGIRDSKQLNEEEREIWFELAKEAHKNGELSFAVSLISHTIIDKRGMTRAVMMGIEKNLLKLNVSPSKSHIYLDGSLKAPSKFEHQLTIIKGDEKVAVIALASIVAKVTRDRLMKKLSRKHPQYGFEKHKGYGTKAHINAIKKFGPLSIHRKTFLKNII